MTTGQIIGLILVLVVGVLGGLLIVKKSKKYNLIKWVGLIFILSMFLTWIFCPGFYQGTSLATDEMTQLGITDIPDLVTKAFMIASDKIVLLLAVGLFYGILSKNSGYKRIVTGMAKKMQGHETTFALVSSLLLTAMTATFDNTYAVLVFVPFVISVLLNMKLDKLTAFAVTFGSMLVGILGSLYGGDGYWYSSYTQTATSAGIIHRLLVLVIGYLVFNFFTILHAKKVLKEKVNEAKEDPYKVENVDSKAKTVPMIIVLSLVALLTVLGNVSWNSLLGVTVLDTIHNWLVGLTVGGVQVFKVLLGQNAQNAALGRFSLVTVCALLGFFGVIVALMSKLKFDEFIDALVEGAKKVLIPIALVLAAYTIFLVVYSCSFVPTLTDTMFKGVTKFNPYTISFMAMIAHVFHIDLGYTGYALATFFTTTFATKADVLQTIFMTTFGFIGFFVPTQLILLIGLGYLNLDYKTWFKYIWKFLLIMLGVLLVLFTLIAYVF